MYITVRFSYGILAYTAYEADRSIQIYRINKIIRPTRMICFLIVTYITSLLTLVIENTPNLYIVK